MHYISQEKLGCAAVTSNPQISMASDKCLLAHTLCPVQVGCSSFPCVFPSRTQVDGGTSTMNIVSSHCRGKRGHGRLYAVS